MTLTRRLKRLEQMNRVKECRCGLHCFDALPVRVKTCQQCGGTILNVVIEREGGFSIGRIGGEFQHYTGFSFADL